jgi:hypothetical protein
MNNLHQTDYHSYLLRISFINPAAKGQPQERRVMIETIAQPTYRGGLDELETCLEFLRQDTGAAQNKTFVQD